MTIVLELGGAILAAGFLLVIEAILLRRWGGRSRAHHALDSCLSSIQALGGNLQEGVCLIDREGAMRYLNPAAERIVGATVAELRGKKAVFVFPPGPRNGGARRGEEHPLLEVMDSGVSIRVDDVEVRGRGGITHSISYVASPIINAGRVVMAVVTVRDVNPLKAARDAEHETYRKLVEFSPDGMLLTDLYGYILRANQRAAALYGYADPHEMLGLNVAELIAREDRLRAIQDKQRATQVGAVTDVEYLSRRKDGTTFTAEMSVAVILNQEGQPEALASYVRDIRERKVAEETLRASEARLTMQYSATRALSDARTVDEAIWKIIQVICTDAGWDIGIFWVVDHPQNVLRCREIWHPPWVSVPEVVERSWEQIFPLGAGIPGQVWMRREPLWITDVLADPRFLRAMTASKEGLHGGFWFPILVEGTVYGIMEFFSHAGRPENGELAQAMASIGRQAGRFIERKLAEEALEHQALHDSLTDLPNRSLLFDRLNQALLNARRTRRPVTLFIMDLDKFKQVNDTFGHHYGDLLLQEAASRLRQTLRGSDTVARLGGDEFAMLLPGTDERGAIQAAEKVVAALDQPFDLEGESLDVGVSIGIALYPLHGEAPSALLQSADAAMYRAKRGHRHFAIHAIQSETQDADRSAGELHRPAEPEELSRS